MWPLKKKIFVLGNPLFSLYNPIHIHQACLIQTQRQSSLSVHLNIQNPLACIGEGHDVGTANPKHQNPGD